MSVAPAHLRTADPKTGAPRTLCGAPMEGGMVLVTERVEASALGLDLCDDCARSDGGEPASR